MSLIRRRLPALLVGTLTVMTSGCAGDMESSGRPELEKDFYTLYATNCVGCHGPDGRHGAAQQLNDALYLALVSEAKLQQVIATGVPGTPMLPFGQEAGGTLTSDQIRVLVNEIRTRWGKGGSFESVLLPAYSAEDALARGLAPGDPGRGSAAQKAHCARCHGPDGRGGPAAGSVVDDAFLSLTSDQALRTAVIAGHADNVSPAWRDSESGSPMSPQEISDVVAWLSSHRGLHD